LDDEIVPLRGKYKGGTSFFSFLADDLQWLMQAIQEDSGAASNSSRILSLNGYTGANQRSQAVIA